jgi:hypothetical protein
MTGLDLKVRSLPDPIGGVRILGHGRSRISQGCSREALRKPGGDGLFYCFVTD